MLHRYWVVVLGWALSGMLLAGCGGVSSRLSTPAAGQTGPEAPVAAVDPSAEKIAEAHAHYAAGVIADMNDETETALKEYYEAASNDPENEQVVLEVSRRLLQAKQPEKALELLTRAAAQPKASGPIYARLGLVYSQLGKLEQAVAADRLAIKKSPRSFSGYQNLFVTFLQNKKPEEAFKVLDEAARQSEVDADFLLSLGEMYANAALQAPSQKEKLNGKALAALRRAEKLKPTNPGQRLRLAEGFALLGDSERAAQTYQELLKKMPDIPMMRERVHLKLAEIYLRHNDNKRAAEEYEAVIREDPTNAEAYYLLGSLAFEAKQPAEAESHFRKTILLRPDFEPAYLALALAQLSVNHPTNALETLEKARAKFPEDFSKEFWTGVAYSHQKNYTEALKHYTAAEVIAKAREPKKLDQLFFFQVGSAYERTGDYTRAEQAFQECLKLAPDSAETLNYLGYMWAEHGIKLEEARALIEKALKAEPKNAAYLDSMGWVLFKLNQPREALGYLLKAVELSEEPDPTVYDHLGDVYAALNEPDKAKAAWRKSLSLEMNDEVRKKLDR